MSRDASSWVDGCGFVEVAVSRVVRLPSPVARGTAPTVPDDAVLLSLLLEGGDPVAEQALGDSGCLVTVLDADGRLLRWSAACDRLAIEPLAGLGSLSDLIERLVPADERADVRSVLEDLRTGRRTRTTSVSHWRSTDGPHLIAWSNSRIELAGRVLVLCVGVEIAADALSRPARQADEVRFRMLAESLPDVVYQFALPAEPVDWSQQSGWSPSQMLGRLEYINDAVAELTGYSAAEFYADPELAFALLKPGELDMLTRDVLGPAELRRPRLLRWIHRDGTPVWGEHRGIPLRDSRGNVVAVQGVVTDVTERVLAERLAEVQARILEMVAQGRPLEESRGVVLAAIETELPGAFAALVERAGPTLEVVGAPSAPQLVGARGDPTSVHPLAGPTPSGPAGDAIDRRGPGGLRDLRGLPAELTEELRGRDRDRVRCVPVGSPQASGGTFLIVSSPHTRDDGRETSLLATFVRLLTIADERDRAGRALRYQACHDDLTGLANRVELLARLEAALATASPSPSASASAQDAVKQNGAGQNGAGQVVAVLFCDLDRFKNINDSLGHSAGDALLVAVAKRLREAAGPGDLVARTGGDEFTVIHQGSADAIGAIAAAGRLVAAMEAPFRVLGRRVYTTMSVGVAVAGGHGTAESLIRDADAAMYRAKERGGRRVELFDTIMQVRARERLELETGLHGALARRELTVEYQPQVELCSGRVVGAEALLRWRHGGRQVPPAEFIPVAEETGLIVPIGAWVLTAACAVAVMHSQAVPGFRMGVNLSARQLGDPLLTDQVSRALTLSGLPPGQLCLEVTETTLMDDAPTALATLRAVHELGVTFAIDDFGTGYSSLLYLKRLPVSALKIDAAFVRGLGHDADDEAIVASTIQLGHSLGRRVIGEGVETQAQQEHLEALGCRYAQGFHLGRPIPPETLPHHPS